MRPIRSSYAVLKRAAGALLAPLMFTAALSPALS